MKPKYKYHYKIFKYIDGEEVFIKSRKVVRVHEDSAKDYLYSKYPSQFFHVEFQYKTN